MVATGAIVSGRSMLVAGFVSVTKVVGTVEAVAEAPEGESPDSVTVTVKTGMVVLMTEVMTTAPLDLEPPVGAAAPLPGTPDWMVTLQEAACLPQVPNAD